MASTIFEDVHYYLFDKNVDNPSEIKKSLKEGGAIREFYLCELVTHIISASPLEQSSLNVPDCHVLHSDWVLMSAKCGAQLPFAPFDLRDSRLFSGLTMCVSKMSRADLEKLVAMVIYYGGKIQRKLDSNVTHLVTMETAGPKYRCALQHTDTVKIVTPDWIIDSSNIGKILPEHDYHPSNLSLAGSNHTHRDEEKTDVSNIELKETVDQSAASHDPSPLVLKLKEQVSDDENTHVLSEGGVEQPAVETRTGTYVASQTSPCLEGTSCDQLPELKSTLEQGLTEDVEMNSLLCKDEPTTTITAACPEETPPTLDHSPSNKPCSGESITQSSQKSTSASSPLLQDIVVCFSDYQDCMEKETIDKWRQVIQQHGGQVLENYDGETCTHLLCLHKRSNTYARAFGDGKCVASAHWLNDILTEQKMFPPKIPLHFPTAFKWQLPGANKYSMTLSKYVDSERELVKDMIRICGIRCTGHLDKQTTHLVCKRPEGKKYEKALEWGVDVINATFLSEMIHNGQLPAVLFPRYTKLGLPDEFSPKNCFEAFSLLKPWEEFMTKYLQLHPDMANDESLPQPHLSSSSPQSIPTPPTANPGKHQVERDTSFEPPGPKKLKLSGGSKLSDMVSRQPQHTSPVVLVTGISQSVSRTIQDSILKLGGRITEKGSECSHIVLPRMIRTVKLLSGLSVCDYIVTPDWVERSSQVGRFLDEAEFQLHDKDAEDLFSMTIASSLNRAKTRKLLQDICFHSTDSVQPPQSSLKEIIQNAGGEFFLMPELKSRFGRKLERLIPGQLVIISTPEDIARGHCASFIKNGISIHNAEFVLTGVLRQELDYTLNRLLPQ